MPISYAMQALQFGSNNLKVPGHEVDIIAENQPAPIAAKLADPNSGVWDLIFSFESGNFFLANASVPGIDKATIQSWYSKEGVNPPGPHGVGFIPFVVDPTGPDTGFAQATHFVDFSQPTPNDSWINTDTIATPNVVATVHQELPEYAKMSISTSATSHSIIITTTSTHAVFDRIFVYSGGFSPVGNTLTVPKANSAMALAIFKKVTTTSSKEIGTIQFPKIPKIEWPQLVAQIVNEIVANQNGELYEHLSPRLLAGLDAATRKAAVAAVSQHIDQLTKIKTSIAGMG
ncbi:MAG: hypothetical protein EPO09_20245 [Aquabacterium sp.]|uniref:hypothetical protein n=1 Tax=Aquabacterium sp. TaxID=1872578 RepID=UPI00120BCDF1|nr:hypothetical protein [Aquabacterium sp.]TAK85318.1 MAG: hypothetical protein EPO09_20245 [Aquabacterium sp.]